MQPKRSVDLMDVGDTEQALACRAVLECFFLRVNLYQIGEARDLVRILGGKQALSDEIVLFAHCIKRGLALPQVAPALEKRQPYHKAIGPSDFREFLCLENKLVIHTGCSLGKPSYAQAFLDAGCRAYIGSTEDPRGDSAFFYVIHFFYARHCRRKSLPEAHRLAARHDSQTRMFRLYERRKS
jgi:hypothetical protein